MILKVSFYVIPQTKLPWPGFADLTEADDTKSGSVQGHFPFPLDLETGTEPRNLH